MVDPKFFNFVCQAAHAFFGSTLVLFVLLFAGPHPLHYLLPIFTGLTALKEFWYDPRYENLATSGGWAGGLGDFFFYQVGAYCSLGLYVIRFHH